MEISGGVGVASFEGCLVKGKNGEYCVVLSSTLLFKFSVVELPGTSLWAGHEDS